MNRTKLILFSKQWAFIYSTNNYFFLTVRRIEKDFQKWKKILSQTRHFRAKIFNLHKLIVQIIVVQFTYSYRIIPIFSIRNNISLLKGNNNFTSIEF